MSVYYKTDRNPNWNYGGERFRLSRSKISLFLDCQRCFYIDNKLGTARPPGFPFNLNSAVDALLKKYSDAAKGNEFATLFQIAGETLLRSPHVDAQSVQYADHTLVLTVTADSMALLNTWLSALHAQPVTIEQKTTTEKEKVTGVIKISGVSK